MQNLLQDLKELFQRDDRLMVEGSLLKSRIIELALKLDKDLVKLLLSHPRLRQHFFADIDCGSDCQSDLRCMLFSTGSSTVRKLE
jgi:adenine-specific DNA-methyltransferase